MRRYKASRQASNIHTRVTLQRATALASLRALEGWPSGLRQRS